MAKVIKHLLSFRDDSGNGWTEVHYRLNPSDNPNLQEELNILMQNIAPLRVLLLSGDCRIIGGRVSYKRDGANASLPLKVFLTGDPDQKGVSSDLSLADQFIDTTFTKSKITHLRGFWDSIEYNGEYHPDAPGADGWNDKHGAWKNALIGNAYGWPSKDPATSAKGKVLNYTIDADLRVTFQVATTLGTLPPVGSIISVRFSKINRSQSVLNKQLNVEVATATTLKTVNQIAAGPFLGQGAFNYRGTSFVRYFQLQNVGLGRRAQGKPIGRGVGRSKVRPLV